MPVIPPGVTPFHIRPACTIGDDGSPSSSILRDTQRVLHFIEDERHLTAQKLLQSVQSRVDAYEQSTVETKQARKPSIKAGKGGFLFNKKEKAVALEVANKENSEMEQVKELLKSKRATFDKLEHRCKLFRLAQQNFSEEKNDEWIYASTHFGIVTYYRREEDGSLTIKLEGDLTGAALFEQICVLKEVDLHYKWSPFCTSSLTLADLDKLDLVGWFVIGMPNFGLARDGCFRAIGCDNIEEDGTVILTGQGIRDTTPDMDALQPNRDTYLSSDPILDKLDIPPVPTRMGSGRMTIRKFDAVIHITSPTSVKTYLVANINPNVSFLPNSLLEFGMKHLTSVVLSKLQGAAKKAALHPVTNPHAIKMREEKDFYQTWLMSKFHGICNARNWDMPPVAAFNLSAADLHKAERLRSHGYRRAQTYNVESPEATNDGIVENMAAVSQSERLAESEDGDNMSMSALSNDTSRKSVWSNNPISVYLRETERKAQERKAGLIADSGRLAAERLQPKPMALDEQERLTTLKLAKYRRAELTPHDTSETSTANAEIGHKSDASKLLSHRLAYQLYHHKPKTRFWVLASLVVTLFTMLQSGFVAHDSCVELTTSDISWFASRWNDAVVVAYILLCAIPHFLLVDVSLIYAFDAMSLGSKTGGQAKVYYSEHVWLGSAVASFGIAFISITLAVKKVLLRFLIWTVHQIYVYLGVHVIKPSLGYMTASMQSVPDSLRDYLLFAISGVSSCIHVVAGAFKITGVLCTGLWRVFFHSNFIGRTSAHFFSALVSATVQILDHIKGFVVYSIKSIDGDVAATPWRVEAFVTAQVLFMNTAIFLLVVLSLYYVSSQKALQAPKVARFKDLPNGSGPAHVSSDVSSISDDTGSLASNRSRSAISSPQRYAAIPEGNVANVVDEERAPFVPDDSESAGIGSRRRFRFRKKKSPSSPNIGGTERAQLPKKQRDRDRLTHSKSY